MADLHSIIKSQEEIISALRAENSLLRARVAKLENLEVENKHLKERLSELERRLGLNSATSSKPPTSDGLKKPTRKPISLRVQSKPKGGQKLHQGKTMEQISNPDKIVVHQVENCCQCGNELKTKPANQVIKRQVFDVSIERVVTEHQVEVKQCECKAYTTGSFPQEVRGPVQIGAKLQSFMIYLSEQFLGKDRLSQVGEDLFGIKISDTTIFKYEGQLARNLKSFCADSLSYLQKNPVKHGDETGIRVGGKTEWMHVLSDRLVSYLWRSSGRKCTLTEIEGVFVHDCYRSYLQLNGSNLIHAFCNAHILRELKALVVYDKEEWADQMSTLLRIMHGCQDSVSLTPAKVARFNRIYDKIVAQGISYHESLPPLKKPARGRAQQRPGHNLVIRLRDYKAGILLFLSHKYVPFTNNQAEQDLRMVKLKQKVSGCFRRQEGAENFARIRSYIGTIRKNGGNVLKGIQKALKEEVRLFQILHPNLERQLALPPPG